MGVIVLLLGCGAIIAGSALAAFLWAANRGHFDDLQTPAIRMLFDDRLADKLIADKLREAGDNDLVK